MRRVNNESNLNPLKTDKGPRSRTGRWAMALGVCALTGCAVLAFAAPDYVLHNEPALSPIPAETLKATIEPTPARAVVPAARVQTEIITILPDGFEPSEITRSHGPVILLVENHSGSGEVSLRLDREAGNRLREVPVTKERLGWSDLVDLNPGKYVLSEANHPDWVCHITIIASTKK